LSLLRALQLRWFAHGFVAALVLLVVSFELPLPQPLLGDADTFDATLDAGFQAGISVATPRVPGVAALSAPAPLSPALQSPRLFDDLFLHHRVAAGETLALIAARYEVDLATLISVNDFANGDPLLIEQELRIPRFRGTRHIVATGEELADVAQRFGLTADLIRSLPANRLAEDRALVVGEELLLPGATPNLNEASLAELGARPAQLGAVVRENETNLRSGPGREYAKVAQIDAWRRAHLVARHGDWLKVAFGDAEGWMRADLLAVDVVILAAVPVTNDIPSPPPRWAWPARGTITSPFGPRWGSFHNGLDIANAAWTPIYAARAGTVTEAGWCRGYGYCVKIAHDSGLATVYGHLIDQPLVVRGDAVAAGELIAYMGSTYDRAGGGYSTGVHLHFTVILNGQAVDPLRFLP
jgi:murein DD-endopeptidase MepM/ murein hydrolase activator NlpD